MNDIAKLVSNLIELLIGYIFKGNEMNLTSSQLIFKYILSEDYNNITSDFLINQLQDKNELYSLISSKILKSKSIEKRNKLALGLAIIANPKAIDLLIDLLMDDKTKNSRSVLFKSLSSFNLSMNYLPTILHLFLYDYETQDDALEKIHVILCGHATEKELNEIMSELLLFKKGQRNLLQTRRFFFKRVNHLLER